MGRWIADETPACMQMRDVAGLDRMPLGSSPPPRRVGGGLILSDCVQMPRHVREICPDYEQICIDLLSLPSAESLKTTQTTYLKLASDQWGRHRFARLHLRLY